MKKILVFFLSTFLTTGLFAASGKLAMEKAGKPDSTLHSRMEFIKCDHSTALADKTPNRPLLGTTVYETTREWGSTAVWKSSEFGNISTAVWGSDFWGPMDWRFIVFWELWSNSPFENMGASGE
jgi:hypothetical protein